MGVLIDRKSPLVLAIALVATLAAIFGGYWWLRRPQPGPSVPPPSQSAPRPAVTDAETHRKIALALWVQGKREEALAEVAVVLELAPNMAEGYMMRGQLLEELGKPGEARSAIDRALEIDPKHVSARLTLARLLAREEKYDDAERELRRVVEQAPKESEARRGLALVLIARGRLAEALPEIREALRLRPDWPLAQGDMAWILARVDAPNLRDPKQAVSLAEAAAKATKRKHAGILDSLAAAYAALGDIQVAAATAQEALQLALDQRDNAFATRVGRRLMAYRAGTIDLDTPR